MSRCASCRFLSSDEFDEPCNSCILSDEDAPNWQPTKADELTTLRARVAELERDLATEQERSEGWRDRAGAATQRVAELEQTVEQLESDACDEREAVAAAESRASAAEARAAVLTQERDSEAERAVQAEAEIKRLIDSHDAAVPRMRELEQRAKRMADALLICRNRTRSVDVAREIDAALAASEGATGGEGKPRCVCTGADCDHSDGGPCACGCKTPCDEAEAVSHD